MVKSFEYQANSEYQFKLSPQVVGSQCRVLSKGGTHLFYRKFSLRLVWRMYWKGRDRSRSPGRRLEWSIQGMQRLSQGRDRAMGRRGQPQGLCRGERVHRVQ